MFLLFCEWSRGPDASRFLLFQREEPFLQLSFLEPHDKTCLKTRPENLIKVKQLFICDCRVYFLVSKSYYFMAYHENVILFNLPVNANVYCWKVITLVYLLFTAVLFVGPAPYCSALFVAPGPGVFNIKIARPGLIQPRWASKARRLLYHASLFIC